ESLASMRGLSSGLVQEAWTARYHGPGLGDDNAWALAADPEGNVYVTGGSFGGDPNYREYATLKYDPKGNPAWLARYRNEVNARAEAVALTLDAKGNIYVAGTVCTEFQIVLGCIHWGYGTIKYNPEGVLIWVARYYEPGAGDDFATAIALDSEENVYVTGRG